MSALPSMSLDDYAARFALDLLPTYFFPDAARQALSEGFDAPPLQVLASMGHSLPGEDAIPLFRRGLLDIGHLPTRHQAFEWLTGAVCHRIVDGTQDCFEGAFEIRWFASALGEDECPSYVWEFYGWADEVRDLACNREWYHENMPGYIEMCIDEAREQIQCLAEDQLHQISTA